METYAVFNGASSSENRNACCVRRRHAGKYGDGWMEEKRLLTTEALADCGVGPEDCVLVAFSGGADSTALLLSLDALRKDGAVAGVCAAHFNHGIRGETAARDEAFCRSLCNVLGIRCITERADTPAYASEDRHDARTGGADAPVCVSGTRKAFVRRGLRCNRASQGRPGGTVLMHLLRGCGTSGLAGMRRRAGTIVRPLLHATRGEILSYLDARGQAHCEDETNCECDAFRNRIRNELLPVLEGYNPNVVEALSKTAGLCEADERYLEMLADEAERRVLRGDGMDRRRLDELPVPLKTRIVRKRVYAACENVTEADIRRVLALPAAKTGTTIELSAGMRAWTDSAAVYIGVYPRRSV
jgi:tRNA(Ile)-lysidine synthase